MFKQLISRIKEDDNPRLHRVTFMALWIVSYGVAWFLPRFYERLAFDYRLYDVLRWLKGGGLGATSRDWWREDILVGLLFGLVLATMQTWLLKRRYGYVPKFWRTATIIGATLGGFGYARVGLAHINGLEFLPVDFIIWFSVIALFQTIVMLQVSRRAWLIALIGILAGLVANGIFVPFTDNPFSAETGLLAGSLIQAIGMGATILAVMANPRDGVIPKRKVKQKSKNRIQDDFHPLTFMGLWLALHLFRQVILSGFWNIRWMLTNQFEVFSHINNWIGQHQSFWIVSGSIWAIAGLILAIGQKWLMQQQSDKPFRHWTTLSAIGWFVAGICLRQYLTGYNLPLYQRLAWLSAFFMIPALFQTLPMLRTMRYGWLWLVTGITPAIVTGWMVAFQIPYYSCYAIITGGMLLSLSTAIAFLFIKSRQNNSPANSVI